MLRKASWAFGVMVVLVQAALGQAPPQPEPQPIPKSTGMNLDNPAGTRPVLPLDGPRRTSLFYFDAEYLLWWVNHGPSPALLTTSPLNGLDANGQLTGGILGNPNTQVLFDGHQLGYGSFSGMRGKVGINVGDDGFWSFEIGGFYLPKRSIDFVRTGNPDGTPLLTIPFLDAATGLQQTLDISSQDRQFQPYLYGGIAIHSDLLVWGYEINAIAHTIRTAERSVDLWVGYRSLGMNENLSINQTVVPTQLLNINFQSPIVGQGQPNYMTVAPNTPVFIGDRFQTRNNFYGAQAGARFSWDFSRITADLTAKVAVGVTHQQVSIDGSSTAISAVDPNTLAPRGTLTTQGGTFALISNSGSNYQNQFTVVPEIGLNLKYALTSWMTLQFGYNATYWSNVVRPGGQGIDPVLNSKLIPTGSLLPTNTNPQNVFVAGQEQGRPTFNFRDTAFWAQGVSFGVEVRY